MNDELNPNISKADQAEIQRADSESYRELVLAIVANRRLAWEIVSLWLSEHNFLLLPQDEQQNT
jgi:hypothetical protein